MKVIPVCTVDMLRAELVNAKMYGANGRDSLGWLMRNRCGTLCYRWF